MASTSIVNSWTEWGQLEIICVGTAQGMCYPNDTPSCAWHTPPSNLYPYVESIIGPRPRHRIEKAQQQLDNLSDLLRAESVKVRNSIDEVLHEDIGEVLPRKQTFPSNSSSATIDGITLKKDKIDVYRPEDFTNEKLRFDHEISGPHFKNQYQFGLACPRDVLITMGNTILEAPTSVHTRYFESEYYKPLIYSLWKRDPYMKWLQPPRPTCSSTHMFNDIDYWKKVSMKDFKTKIFVDSGYKTNLNENEIAFDAADIMRMGKDIFYKKSVTANNQGLHWLRRTFPDLRVHMMHFPTDGSCHIDCNLLPLRPPTAGSEGLVLLNQAYPPLANEIKIFTDNNWRPIVAPKSTSSEVPPLALCSQYLNTNILSINDHCVVIEECETALYNLLHDDLGFDVITCPLRILNEFGGSVHCVTWDIRRDDSCVDYFPNQDYEAECKRDLDNYSDRTVSSTHDKK